MKRIGTKDLSDRKNDISLSTEETERLLSVRPNDNQIRLAEKPFYVFIHFGMNTATGREWGSGKETVQDFDIRHIDVAQWVDSIVQSGATGIILTCKHHDGFCLWNTAYTDFNIMNTLYGKDLTAELSAACQKAGLDFGVYLSPWDMHEKSYGSAEYNDYFAGQLTELLTNYGEIFEVWFDGAKGSNAKDFTYDWERYYGIIRSLQPGANIAVCGPDIRWVGNEAGKARKNEYCVVPDYLRKTETIAKNSQHEEGAAAELKRVDTMDEDLGSRELLSQTQKLCWYPAEVDVSIRKGWFHRRAENLTVKSVGRLFGIYLTSVGNNCTLLLNVPPSRDGVIDSRDRKSLQKLGKKLRSMTAKPILTREAVTPEDNRILFDFGGKKTVRYCILQEDIAWGQRIEAFALYLKKPGGKKVLVYRGGVIGMRKIIPLTGSAVGAQLEILGSRGEPHIKFVGFYE
ncbi:MAG: alpha-L-fucosidase [Acutalibacteraceae bacterium]